MPILNPNKCFAQQKQRLTITVPETLPNNWLTEFYALLAAQLNLNDEPHKEDFDHKTNKWVCLTKKAWFFNELDKHVGEQSTYSLKSQVLKLLGALYAIFKDPKTTLNQKQMIASGIATDVKNCSPGFTNRVSFVMTLFNMPQNLDELIAQVRFNLVDRIARIIAAQNTQGIHVHNRVIEVARGAGFGVWPISTDDVYRNTGSSNLSNAAIIKTVKTGFANHFQLFALLNALRDQIEAFFVSHGYEGKRDVDNDYKGEAYEKWSECLKRFVSIERAELLERDVTSGKVINIHWRNIKAALLQKLRDEGYVKLSKKEGILLDENSKNLSTLIPHAYELAQCLEFFSEWRMEQKVALVKAYLNSKSPNDQKEILTILHNEAPQLTAQLQTDPNLQALYFAIAIGEKDSETVRTYVEQGADINRALALLFSEAHKSETLYWLHEHPSLLQQMTLAGMNTVISQGKYQGKTIAETLVSTKKGRQLLEENKALQTLFSQTKMANTLSDVLEQAETEKKTGSPQVGFFKKPHPLARELVQSIVDGDLKKAEELLNKANAPLLEILLTEKVTVIDYSKRKIKQKTAFQAALCAMDDELCERLAKYMSKEEIESQYQAIFPKGHKAYYQAQTPFDFSQIVGAISQSSENDVEKARSLEIPNNTAIWGALEQFRAGFAKQSYQENVFNPQHLTKAFELYNKQFNNWSGPQRILFWQQVIGYVQRFLPANIAMDFAQGLYDRIENKKKSNRSFKFTYGDGSIFPLDFGSFSGLGYEYAAGAAVGGPLGEHSWMGVTSLYFFSKLMSSKNSNLGRIMQPESSYSHPRWCLIQ